ncbi:hypothetical protein [Tenacibaculum caenipelagi]|uniref:Lipocalin-like protein n=1 Tax=Tenacibaculum caenipelagi TaxID=1325435 RepID=A0A4R6TF68_9FLAO|nr:hypothetical protein [Tenacibaculum caenipelagi]TDQ28443.1 hypothetical protein DFQ07_0813 [Tenacibaculum caenipelagi]
MKFLKTTLVLFSVLLVLSSCRTEEIQIINPPIENELVANSTVANLMKYTVTKDGSDDNIIDRASCLSVKLPVTVTVNSKEITVNDEDGYEEIEDIFDLFDDDVDSIVISYPIEVILSDYTVKTVNSDEELEALAQNCKGENEDDDDIECLDFYYPLTASVFNSNQELILTLTIENDEEMYELIGNLKDYAAVTIDFPFKVILNGDTYVYINNMQELEEAIAAAKNSCDEDDDNDYNDDDCDGCTTEGVKEIFANCNEWIVEKLYIDQTYLTDEYKDFVFNFKEGGIILVNKNGTVYEGSWEVSGEANDMKIVVNVPDFPDFNAIWYLHEVKEGSGEVSVHLLLEGNHLRFKSQCSVVKDELSDILLAEGSVWAVENYKNNGVDETETFTNYQIYFYLDNVVKAKKDGVVMVGSWEVSSDASILALNFSDAPVNEFNKEWAVVSTSEIQVVLEANDRRLVIKRIN